MASIRERLAQEERRKRPGVIQKKTDHAGQKLSWKVAGSERSRSESRKDGKKQSDVRKAVICSESEKKKSDNGVSGKFAHFALPMQSLTETRRQGK